MKKILFILLLTLSLCTLSSCKYNVSKFYQVTQDEAEDFIKGLKNPFYEDETSFKYSESEQIYEISLYSKRTRQKEYNIYGTLNKNNIGEIHYDAYNSTNQTNYSIKGKEKTKYSVEEIGDVFSREKTDDSKYYFTVKVNSKIPNGKIKQEILRTTLLTDSTCYNGIRASLYQIINTLNINYSNDSSNYDVVLPNGDFYYVKSNKLKIVSSTNNSHIESVYVFEDGVLSAYKYTYKQIENGLEKYIEKELIIKNVKEVKIPKNAENYKTEYQKYEPGFFENISFGLFFIILAIILIIAFIVFVIIRIVKRPKFTE